MKRFSGKFVLRIPLKLHEKLANLSASKELSLNQFCILLLNKGLAAPDTKDLSEFQPVIKKVSDAFQDKLIGVVLFGSRATGSATDSSDIDILVILDSKTQINRSFYIWWDEEVEWRDGELNPHFVSYPDNISEISGLWFEVAISGKVIFQKDLLVENLFLRLKKFIADGNVRRYMSNGHPYWVRRKPDEEQKFGD